MAGARSRYQNHDLLYFGEHGLEKIDWPGGDGTWLSLEKGSVEEKGAKFSTHNCDTTEQQSLLFAIWNWWAQHVEGELDLESTPKSTTGGSA